MRLLKSFEISWGRDTLIALRRILALTISRVANVYRVPGRKLCKNIEFFFIRFYKCFLILVPVTSTTGNPLILENPPKWGEAGRYATKQHRKIAGRATFQGQVYNFLERPDNWKCFLYHIIV